MDELLKTKRRKSLQKDKIIFLRFEMKRKISFPFYFFVV